MLLGCEREGGSRRGGALLLFFAGNIFMPSCPFKPSCYVMVVVTAVLFDRSTLMPPCFFKPDCYVIGCGSTDSFQQTLLPSY